MSCFLHNLIFFDSMFIESLYIVINNISESLEYCLILFNIFLVRPFL